MKKKVPALIFSLFIIYPVSAFCLDIPRDLQEETALAMKSGKALYDAYSKGPGPDKVTDEARSKVSGLCEFRYNAYVVDTTVYLIAEPPSPEGIVFGRHYKISGADVTKSTDTCFATPPPPTYSLFAFTTHHLSDAPTEFHVFLSLKHTNPIYVRTRRGYWKVDRGIVTFVEKKE